jgi:hypothetical protein
MDVTTLEIVIPCLFRFVMTILRVALVEPTDTLPKFTEVGLTLTFACASEPKAKATITTAATSRILPLILPAICIPVPHFWFAVVR